VLAKVLNEAIENIDSCMKTELSVNIDKTNYVIFQSKQKKSIQDLSPLIDDKLLIRKQKIKLLGVLLDENLSWKPHVNPNIFKFRII
jgi:hypothetical protein